MNAREITKQLKASGGVKQIAQKMGVTSPTVSQVIYGLRPNPRIRRAIAEAVGKSVSELWPDRAI